MPSLASLPFMTDTDTTKKSAKPLPLGHENLWQSHQVRNLTTLLLSDKPRVGQRIPKERRKKERMLSIQNDFSHFDRLDWATTYEVSIRFLVELLAHAYGKKPEQIIEAFCLCSEALPTLRYEEEEFEDPSDPQWMLFRYHTVLHTKDLLSNTLKSSAWGLVQSKSLSCREEIKYKSETYPSASNEEIIFQSDGLDANGAGSITRIVTPPRDLPLEECWAYRHEVEQYLASNRAFDGWLDLLPISVKESESKNLIPTERRDKPIELPRWDFRPLNTRFWSIGPNDDPKTISKMGGFFVIRSGLIHLGTQLVVDARRLDTHPSC